MEFMCNDLELDAGAPVNKLPWKMSKEEKAMVAAWRKTVDVRRFEEVRAKYEAAGVRAHIVKFGYIDGSLSDADLDYCFKVAQAMGAATITREVPDPKSIPSWEKNGRRLAGFAERYGINIAFHNHLQINATTYDGPLLGWSNRFMINFDIGHYVASNDDDPLAFVEKYASRISSIHVKDRRRDNGPELPFGTGDTPLKDLFAALKAKRLDIPCDIEVEFPMPQGSNAVQETDKCREFCRRAILG
jgi:sugar phosphate isomerase/epimerase